MSHPPDLSSLVKKGALRRRHHLLRDLSVVAVPIVLAILCQAGVYAGVLLQAPRQNWTAYAIVISVLSLVPIVSASLLASMRQQEFPLTVPAVLTIIVYNFAVAGLSAVRVHVSYVGLAAAAPMTIILMVYANITLRRALSERIGILDFPGAEALRKQLGGQPLILTMATNELDKVDRVLIDGETHHKSEWSRFLTRLLMIGVEVTPWQKHLETRLRRVDIANFDMLHLSYSFSQILYSRLKRLIDVVFALLVTPVVAILCAVVAAYIWLLDGRPVVFRQPRRGYGGSTFTLYKFRTMYRDAGDRQAQANDARILPGARFLRLLRLDELPQLVNILRGEMSWIGPRPVTVRIAEELEARLPQYAHRHLVLPGLTGWAQVSLKYAENSDEEIEKLSYDLYYIKELSFDLDVLILIKTAEILLSRRGAR